MTEKSISTIRNILRAFTSGFIVILGSLLTAACIMIYISDTYSRESATTALTYLLWLIILTVLSVIAGLIFEKITDSKISDTPNRKDNANILKRLYAKKDISKCEPELAKEISANRRARKIRSVILAISTTIASVVSFIGAIVINIICENVYKAELNTFVIIAVLFTAFCFVFPFGFAVYTAFSNDKSTRKEIELLKSAPNRENAEETKKQCGFACADVAKVVILILGVGLLVYGYMSGGIADVLTKAINICTECIGLG